MGWPLRKILPAAAIPAAIFFVAWTSRDLTNRSANEFKIDVILPIIIIAWGIVLIVGYIQDILL